MGLSLKSDHIYRAANLAFSFVKYASRTLQFLPLFRLPLNTKKYIFFVIQGTIALNNYAFNS